MRKLAASLAAAFGAAVVYLSLALAFQPPAPAAPAPTPTPSASPAVPDLPPCLARERPAQLAPLGPARIDRLVLHHWGGTPPATRELARLAFTTRGYVDIAYQGLVTRDGQLWPGRPEGMQSAATYGWNERSKALCLLGDLTRERATDAQLITAGRWLVAELRRYPGAKFCEHADAGRAVGYGTECAGDHTAAPITWQLACGFKLPEARRRAAGR